MIESIRGARAVVTGGASGIGRGLVAQLLDRGASVVALDIEQAALDRLATLLGHVDGRLHTFAASVSSFDQVQAAKQYCDEVVGGVDILFNNAGIASNALPFWEIPNEAVEWNFDVNVFGVIHGVRAFLPDMIARGSGHVVNTASIGGFQVSPLLDLWHQGLYASTKYAVVALSEALAIELEGKGVGVSILAPGGVATGIAASDRDGPGNVPGAGTTAAMQAMLAASGMAPETVADMAIEGLLRNDLYIFTHTEFRERLAERARRIDASFEATTTYIARKGLSQAGSRSHTEDEE